MGRPLTSNTVSDDFSYLLSQHTSGMSLGGVRTKSAHELLYARQSVVSHARAFGLDPVDLVDIDYKGTVAQTPALTPPQSLALVTLSPALALALAPRALN